MQDKTPAASSAKLDESELIEELKRLRTQIPDNPSLNPILNVAFDLSRRLESGDRIVRGSEEPCRPVDGPRLRSPRAPLARESRLRRPGVDAQGFHGIRRKDRERGWWVHRGLRRALVSRAHRHRSDGASDLWSFRRALSPDGRNCGLRHACRGRDDRLAPPSRRDADAAARAQVRARRDRQSAQRLRRAVAWLLQRCRAEIRRRGVQASAETNDVRVLGWLRP